METWVILYSTVPKYYCSDFICTRQSLNMCTVTNCVVIFVYVSCRFLMGSLQLWLLCFFIIMLFVQLSFLSACTCIVLRRCMCSSRKDYIVLNLVSVVEVDPL